MDSTETNLSGLCWNPRPIGMLVGFALWANSAFGATAEQPISFVNDVMPVLTKAGCNAGACHAKAGGGQRGFQLSLLGFEPADDYTSIVKEGRGRRLFYAAPERSLILMKASGQMPHGGGVRLAADSEGYHVLVQCIRQGTPYRAVTEPNLMSGHVEPVHVSVPMTAEKQLKALAKYSDGSVSDATRLAL